MNCSAALIDQLRSELGAEAVITDDRARAVASMDIYAAGATAEAIVCPASPEELSIAMRFIGASGTSVVPRGGGMSYTGGIVPPHTNTIVIDTARMDRIIEIDNRNMFVRVEAGCTWQSLWETLQPKGLRVPFWGPLSGSAATVGGSVSQHAVLWGSGRYGPSADSVLGLDTIMADGTTLRTGMGAIEEAIPNWRHFGPDLTGLFLGDCGALGIKATVTLRLMRVPAEPGFASYTFGSAKDLIDAMCELARTDTVVAGFGLDPKLTEQRVRRGNLADGAGAATAMIRRSDNKLGAVRDALKMATRGRAFLPAEKYTLHLLAEGRSRAAVDADLKEIGRACSAGTAVDGTVPKLMYNRPFASLTSALGPEGQRWAPMHVLTPLGDAVGMWDRIQELVISMTPAMTAHNIEIGFMFGTVSNTTMLIELVMTWPGPRSILYEDQIPASKLRRYPDYDESPEADSIVANMRDQFVDLFSTNGGAHLQIGRRYRYFDRLDPATQQLLVALKRAVDPDELLNPGAIGLPVSSIEE